MSAPVPQLGPGVRVVITQGLAAGKIGVVIEKWASHFGRGVGPAMWRISSDDLVRTRILRADYLKVIP